MATVEVRSDGTRWKVTVNGTTKSHHRKKARAVKKGRQLARKHGGTLRIQRQDGTYQDVRRY